MTDEAFSIPRPHLSFRVGVAGARKLPPQEIERLRHEIKDVLETVRDEIARLAKDEKAAAIYAPAPPGAATLRLLSPLAEGADRRVAEEALKLGYALHAPLPFPRGVYEQDFPETIETFRALLAQAEVFELDGEAGNFAPESYREVGRFVVRNCDLLIALWDGEREKGPGGTAEIVRYAANARVPVWRIDPTRAVKPGFIDSPQRLRSGAATGEDAKEGLKRYLKSVVLPPNGALAGHRGLFATLAHLVAKPRGRADATPLEDYLAEEAPVSSFFARAYGFLTRCVMPKPKRPIPPLEDPCNAAEQWWRAHYLAADRVAIGEGDRYRSSYVWIAFFAFVALVGAALAFVLPHASERYVPAHETEMILIGVEVFALLAIVFVVTAGHARRWHEKWIAYRLLAELCRKQYVLSSVGRVLPSSEAFRAAEASEAPRDAWIAWWFAALQRAAPLPVGALTADRKQGALELALSLAAEQNAYHDNCETRYEAAARALERLGERLFVVAGLLTAVKAAALVLGAEEGVGWSGALAICVSAASASFVGVRAYSEFALLARQSAQMRRAMTQAEDELKAIRAETPLSSIEIGHALYSLALTMLQDVGGWARLFRMKTLGAA